MNRVHRWSRVLVIAGLIGLIGGMLDPLEGSIIVAAGIGFVTIGAVIGRSPKKKLLFLSFALVAVGVAALWGLSSVGGFGGTTGRSFWWALVLLPYPAGWILGIVCAVRCLREVNAAGRPEFTQAHREAVRGKTGE